MQNMQVYNVLKKEKQVLANKFGVEELVLFGSYARWDEKPDSDVDLLVSFKEMDFNKLMGAYIYIEKLLGKKVDFIRNGPHITEKFLNAIKKDMVYVWR